jgi:hypothetical protein
MFAVNPPFSTGRYPPDVTPMTLDRFLILSTWFSHCSLARYVLHHFTPGVRYDNIGSGLGVSTSWKHSWMSGLYLYQKLAGPHVPHNQRTSTEWDVYMKESISSGHGCQWRKMARYFSHGWHLACSIDLTSRIAHYERDVGLKDDRWGDFYLYIRLKCGRSDNHAF